MPSRNKIPIRFMCRQFGDLLVAILVCVSAPSLSFAAARECSTIKYPAPSGKQNDIDFVFDKPYVCGQFANGDWWVSANGKEAVNLIAVKPEARDGLHGLEINPSRKDMQAFDRRISGYDTSLTPSLPMKFDLADLSIVKAVSIASEKPKCRPCLQFSAVLTVVRAPVARSENILRPGYFGNEKIFYSLDSLRSDKLGQLIASSISERGDLPIAWITKRYQGVQLDHIEGWVGRDLHPKDNLPDYGADIARDNAIAILRMLLDDFNINNKSDRMALANYLQMSVDLRSMAVGGVGWPPNGGHGNGRKFPILFGGLLLDDSGFTKAVVASVFSEDEQVYISANAGRALFGLKCSDEQYWMTTRLGKGKRDCRDPYGYIDGGGHEIGEAYQHCCTAKPWKYTALGVDLLGLREAWGKDAFFEYVDRWVRQGVHASPDPCAPFDGNVKTYGVSYGPAGSGACIKGKGRYLVKHGQGVDTGLYSSKFGDQMWSRFYTRP